MYGRILKWSLDFRVKKTIDINVKRKRHILWERKLAKYLHRRIWSYICWIRLVIQMICSVRKYLKIHVVQVISFRKLLDVISGMGGHAK